jgi:hypothetical protein
VFPLTPLYNDVKPYYAESIGANNCTNRVSAAYTVNNCVINGYCPGFTAGDVGLTTAAEACGTYDSGQIGVAGYPAEACNTSSPGQIGTTSYPAACVSYSAGWIGN